MVNFFKNKKWVVLLILLSAGGTLGAQTLQELADQTRAQVWWDSGRQLALLTTENKRLTIDPRTRMALGNGKDLFTLIGVQNDEKGLRFDSGTYKKLKDWFLDSNKEEVIPNPRENPLPQDEPVPPAPKEQKSETRVQVIVIDAGHGGSDPGSMAKHSFDGKEVTIQEKNLTLAVALELEKLLKTSDSDRTIVLTRRDDSYPTLEERVKIAHAQKLKDKESIIFLSIHFNASLNKNAKGLEFWYVPPNYEREVISDRDVPESVFPVVNALVDAEFKKESRQIALNLADSLGKELGDENTQRGLKENPWFVVRMTRMPAVLVELGFITNEEESKKMTNPEYLKKLARGLYNGLQTFIRSYEGRS